MATNLSREQLAAFDRALSGLDLILDSFCGHHGYERARMLHLSSVLPDRVIIRTEGNVSRSIAVQVQPRSGIDYYEEFFPEMLWRVTSGACLTEQIAVYRWIGPLDRLVLPYHQLLKYLPRLLESAGTIISSWDADSIRRCGEKTERPAMRRGRGNSRHDRTHG